MFVTKETTTDTYWACPKGHEGMLPQVMYMNVETPLYRYCQECGSELIKKGKGRTELCCSECGAGIANKNWKYCIWCGAKG